MLRELFQIDFFERVPSKDVFQLNHIQHTAANIWFKIIYFDQSVEGAREPK